MKHALSWLDEARYGMFIHWGAYAVAARGEWAAYRAGRLHFPRIRGATEF
jgi:hypothetical protein